MTATPPRWDDAQLTADRLKAIQLFREERMTEPLDHYLSFYEQAYQLFAEVLEETSDLRRIRENAAAILTVKDRQHLTRYIASPPLSEDDLKTIADVSLSVGKLKANPDSIETVISVILDVFDRQRFPWVSENRDPTVAEKHAALVSTAAMYAFRQTETWRRKHGKTLEQELKEYLKSIGFTEVPPSVITNSSQGPLVGQFCGETMVVGGKADVVIKLFDGRLMPIECKVSNSETNSYKRLIHDCGEKAQSWVHNLGPANCLPAAVLSGCYSLGNLKKAQSDMGLALIWSHEFAPLGQFLDQSKQW